MKKLTLFLVAMLFSALSFAALNPYAYGLSSSLDGTTLKVNYSLNAPATAVSVVIMDGETEVKTVTCNDKISKGSHSVDISTLDLPTGKSLTWKVVVSGNEVTMPTAISGYRLYHPASVDIDNNTESPYFGRILATEAMQSVASKTDTYLTAGFGAGIIEFNAAFEHLPNGKKVGYTGGKTFVTTSNYFAPRRIRISKDGRIFATAQDNSGEYLWEINPDNLDSWTSVFQGTKSDFTLQDGSGKFIAGTNSGFDVRGTGENLQLLMLSANKPGAQVATFKLHEYNLGDATSWSTVPTRELSGCQLHNSMITNQSQVQYDNEGGYWITYWVNTTNSNNYGGIAHFKKDGTRDFIKQKINLRNAGFRFNHDFTKVIIATNDVTGASKTYKQATVYAVSKDVNDAPVLTKETTIDMTTVGNNLNDFAWDYADNIYVVGNSAEWIYAYALPHSADKIVSTPCASKYAFKLYTITARAADNAMGYVTGGGTYSAGETVTLKATAKTGYYFTQWNDGNTDNPRAITVTGDAEYIAEFAQAYPRVYAYDLDVADNGDSYTFSFKPNTNAVSGNLLLYNEDGTAVVQTHAISTAIVAHTATTITLNKADLPNQADVPWAIQLSGNPIPAFAETFADADYRFAKGHAAVDNSPESEYFGRVYVADRRSTKSKSGFYVYNIDFTPLNTEANKLGMDKAGYSRPAVGADGTVYLTGYTDDESGIFVVDPADLTKCTQFYNGTRAGSGLFTNGGAELGSSTSGVGVYGEGKNAVLYSMMEDGTGANANSGKQPIVKYQIGQEDGTVLKQWSTAPTWHINYPATGKDSYNFGNNAFAATEKGVWISQNKSNDADRPEIAFIDKEGEVQFMQNLNKSQGAGLAVNADNTVLYLQKAGEILEYNITWTGNKPALTLAKTYPVSLQYITTLSLDYAGNLIACAGTQYGNNTDNNVMKLVAYTLPTDNNTCTVPAAKAKALKLGVRYNVEVLVNDNTMGRATGGGDYKEGETATLTATPAEHHRFVNWTKGAEIVSTEATYSFAVTENITLTATFEAIPQYTITVSANDGEMGSVTGGGTYDEGSTATLTATPVGGYVFEKWSDDNTDNPRTITVNGAAAYTAIFKVAPARVFAYNLDVVDNGDETYTLSFIPNANATSGRVILYNDDTKAQIHEESIAGSIVKGVKSEVVISKSVLPAAGIVTWAVELTGEPVEKLTLLTKANDKANYGFNRPQGVAIDNNPASDFFGRIYIALPKAGGTYYTDKNYGIVVMDPLHNRLKSGIVSHNDALGSNGRYSMHRVAVNPTNGHVYYVRTSDSKEGVTGTAIYELTPDATNILTDGGTAKNVISGASDITNANSVCFDETGAMYVMANANYDSGASLGRVYKVVDGVATLFTPNSIELASRDNAIVPDGKGGFWAAQHRDNFDTFSHLLHITATGTVDYSIDKNSADASLLPIQTYTKSETTYNNASYRGQVAYYSIDENNGLVAYGGGAKVSVFKVSYDGAGKPSLSAWQTISLLQQSTTEGINVDGIAFDYAGNIIVMSATDERMYQYALPIESANTSLVPSPTSKAIKLGTIYTVEVAVNDPAMGTATGGGEYIAGETATLEATPAANHNFVNWTYGSETSTDNPLSLVVNGDITVTANFAPVQYTLIAPTNDENKGTVTGAGTYAHGTVATLTATPKPGYKLLYWSDDRSTENPRTITMTKNEAISAYFVKDYAEEPTFKIEKMWENTNVPASTTNGYQAVGWDGKIYMQNRTAGKIITYSSTEDTGTEYATSGLGQQIAVDEAGNLIVFNATFSTANPNAILIYQKGSTAGKAVSFTLKDPAACHFFSASGDIYSAEGGYVYFYCNGKTAINRLKITNGAATASDVTTDLVGGSIYSGGTQNHVMVDIFGNLVAHARSNAVNVINVHTNESKAFTLPNIKMGTLGGCSFELGGKELWAYHAGASNYSSEWNIYNMTDDVFLSDDDFYAVDKSATTNYACNWLNVQVVDEYTAYIYQFCPLKAAAVWKVSIQRDDLQEYAVTATANDASMGSVTGGGTYYEGATATLTATPHAGYRFVNWTKAGVEVSTDATYTFTVTEDVELVANFEALPEIVYELNGGVWNKYGWTSKKNMYDAFIADWKAYSGSTRGTKTYEEQYGIGKSNDGIPVTIQDDEDILGFMAQEKWEWLGQFLDALAIAQAKETMPTTAVKQMRFGLGNFFGEDNNQTGWLGAVDCSGNIASLSAFAPYWGQTFPLPTQPTEEVVLNAPYKEGYEFDGWYAASDFSGAEVTTVDETTKGTLYAKWLEHFYTRTVTSGRYGTICLPYGSSNMTGAIFYEIAWKNESTMRVFVDEVTELEAGKPYIFLPTSSQIKVVYQGEEADEAGDNNGLYGTFDAITDGPAGTADNILENNYMLSDNKIIKCLGNCKLPANRAYFKLDKIPTTEPSLTPGRRRVALDVQGGNEATGVDNLTEDGVVPAMEGTYDVLGRKMTEPTNTGFYIVNGKKVVIVK